MKTTPQPFDPDAIGGSQTQPLMLSDLLSQQQADLPEAGPGTSAPLDNRRKGLLASLSRRAWLELRARGVVSESETLEAFRGRIAEQACGRRIRCAVVGDYKLIQAALLSELGQHRAAQQAAAQAVSTARDIALAKLWQTVRQRKLNAGYAEGIAQRIYKRAIAQLHTKELWTVIFTMTNNANARDGKGKASNRFKSLKQKRQSTPHHD